MDGSFVNKPLRYLKFFGVSYFSVCSTMCTLFKTEGTQRPLPPTHQNNPQTPKVTGLVVAVVFQDLWRGVLQREAGSLQELIVGRFEAGKAKVYDFDLGVLALVREEQVLPGNKYNIAIISKIGHQDSPGQVL